MWIKLKKNYNKICHIEQCASAMVVRKIGFLGNDLREGKGGFFGRIFGIVAATASTLAAVDYKKSENTILFDKIL